MFIIMTKQLEDFIRDCACDYDAIVVEGFDGVGKGNVLSKISKVLGVVPYRPDYNLWSKYDHRAIDRWKVSGFFWDIFSHFNQPLSKPMLFDRGVISGSVYNNDIRIAYDYRKLLRDMRVLHILVTCNEEDYRKFSRLRSSSHITTYQEYLEYTERYKEHLRVAGASYVIYENRYDMRVAEESKNTCLGCGHYSYGICRHPLINKKVDPMQSRCEHSQDEETQDREVVNIGSEMQCV